MGVERAAIAADESIGHREIGDCGVRGDFKRPTCRVGVDRLPATDNRQLRADRQLTLLQRDRTACQRRVEDDHIVAAESSAARKLARVRRGNHESASIHRSDGIAQRALDWRCAIAGIVHGNRDCVRIEHNKCERDGKAQRPTRARYEEIRHNELLRLLCEKEFRSQDSLTGTQSSVR